MVKVMTVLLAGLWMAGCVSTDASGPSAQQRRELQVEVASADCMAKARSGQFKSLAALGRCLSAAEAYLADEMGDNADLLRQKLASRIAIYERIDRGELTGAQAEAELARVNATLMAELNRRSHASRSTMAGEGTAPTSLAPVICNRLGFTVTCF